MAAIAPTTTPIPDAALAGAALRFQQDIKADLVEDKLIWPSVPTTVLKVRAVMRDPDASVDDIARAVSLDPALSTRLVRVANSVYHGGFNPCKDLKSAVVRLGNSAIEHAILVLAVAKVFSVGKRRRIQPYLQRLWDHSTLVAAVAELLAGETPNLAPDVAMLAGLTHDIGALPILVRAEKVTPLIENPALLNPLVRTLHCEIGRAMLQAWRFPPELVSVAAGHEHLSRRKEGPADYVDVVIAANLVACTDTGHPHTEVDWDSVPAIAKLGLTAEGLKAFLEQAQERDAELKGL